MPPPDAGLMIAGLGLFMVLLTRAQLGLDATPNEGMAIARRELLRARRHLDRGLRVRPADADPAFADVVWQADTWLERVGPIIADDVAELTPADARGRAEAVRRTWLALAAAFHDVADEAEKMASD